MDWFTTSFAQHTVIWLLLSSVLGGFVGSAIKFGFEDLLRPRFNLRRAATATVQRFSVPILRSTEALERRINNFIRNDGSKWHASSEYYRLSNLYVFGEYLSWIRIIERELGFLPAEATRAGSGLTKRVNGFYKAVSSFAYFRWSSDQDEIERSAIPRLMLTAIGEAMTESRDGTTRPLEFTAFLIRFEHDEQFRRWFSDLDTFLTEASLANPMRWDRLIAAQASLRVLALELDPKSEIIDYRPIENLDRILEDGVLEALRGEFSDALSD